MPRRAGPHLGTEGICCEAEKQAELVEGAGGRSQQKGEEREGAQWGGAMLEHPAGSLLEPQTPEGRDEAQHRTRPSNRLYK